SASGAAGAPGDAVGGDCHVIEGQRSRAEGCRGEDGPTGARAPEPSRAADADRPSEAPGRLVPRETSVRDGDGRADGRQGAARAAPAGAPALAGAALGAVTADRLVADEVVLGERDRQRGRLRVEGAALPGAARSGREAGAVLSGAALGEVAGEGTR